MPNVTVRSPDLLRRQRLRLACCVFLLALAALWPGRAAHAAQPWREALPGSLQTVGSGTMTWLGFRIYHATLWAPQKPLDESQPFALQLDYKVKISRDKLATTSIEEIQRMSPAPIAGPTLARWKNELQRAFIDVADGDELVGVYLPQRGMRLYDRERLLAEIADPELARSFFNIWLGQPSRDDSLRRRLLGETP
ncbi:chalcone isomerase family protein [Herbaspirillum sp. DW155]|uniref:chalcone isomerase family protein n=1 Tax=Herbaspirillum sp. DW155 TaxID=3095609 RepID=UPI003091A82F|nr:chalcone isomerase family protein [Herbaspirillum sp. DW155]